MSVFEAKISLFNGKEALPGWTLTLLPYVISQLSETLIVECV